MSPSWLSDGFSVFEAYVHFGKENARQASCSRNLKGKSVKFTGNPPEYGWSHGNQLLDTFFTGRATNSRALHGSEDTDELKELL